MPTVTLSTKRTDKVSILGSQISVWNLDETVQKLRDLCKDGGRHYVCISNVHTVVMGHDDPAYAEVTNGAVLATADGVPLIWASRALGGPAIHGRASGPDIMRRLLESQSDSKLRHYFYGSTDAVVEKLEKTLARRTPGATLAGFYSPPKRDAMTPSTPLNDDELADCARINAASPDIVWVGLGAPKQEIWMRRARPHLKAAVLVGVGAAFDFLAGNKKRAPQWMQLNGLEWAYRFMQEPRRLAMRYLKTNPVFVVAVAKQALLSKVAG